MKNRLQRIEDYKRSCNLFNKSLLNRKDTEVNSLSLVIIIICVKQLDNHQKDCKLMTACHRYIYIIKLSCI